MDHGVAGVTRYLAAGREHRIVAFALLTGALTGLAVAVFDRIVATGMVERVESAPLGVQVAAPLVGLALTAVTMQLFSKNNTTSVSDEYIKTFHGREARMPLRRLPAKIAAAAFTLGSGCALGFEGPSIFLGATIGSTLQHRLSRWFTRDEAKALLVAGAAAGVAAIFKAPATGALFALEVPFQADLARRSLIPALLSAAAGYLAFASVNGTTPLFPIGTTPPLNFNDLAAAVAIGLLAGLGARGFAWVIRQTKTRTATLNPALRVGVFGVAIGGLILASQGLTGEPLALGPGYGAIAWAFEPKHAVGVIIGLLLVRGAATAAAVGAGGVGGLFVPLVIEGALLGRLIGSLVGHTGSTLFPVLGIAAFLGAGYHVPLAAVVFVAESTGRPGFVVPGLIAAAAAQLTMGPNSVTTYQRTRRVGHLEGRLGLPITSVVRTDAATVPADATVADVFDHHLIGVRLLAVPVVDGSTYRGFVHLHDITATDRSTWATTKVDEIMRTDHPVADLTWTLGQALAALQEGDTDRMAVVGPDGYVGLVTTGEILKLGEILRATEGDDGQAGAQAFQKAT